MVALADHMRPNEEEVAAKVIDGEAILINLSNGIYYSMDKVAASIWELIEGRQTLSEIVAAIVARYDVSPEQAEVDVERLTAELLQENLAKVSNDGLASRESSDREQPRERLPYETPTLNIYRDMGDLLALDPPMPGLSEIAWKEPDEGTSD